MGAAESGDVSTVKTLLQAGVDVDSEVTEEFYRHSSRGVKTIPKGATALYLAIRWGRHAVVKVLLSASTYTGVQDGKYASLLSYAVRQSDGKMVQLLVDHLKQLGKKRKLESEGAAPAKQGKKKRKKVKEEKAENDQGGGNEGKGKGKGR